MNSPPATLPRVIPVIARGYRQRLVLARLLAGESVIHPCYWRNGRLHYPRYQELRSWQRFCERLVAAGYALEVQYLQVLHPAYTVYTLRRLEEVVA